MMLMNVWSEFIKLRGGTRLQEHIPTDNGLKEKQYVFLKYDSDAKTAKLYELTNDSLFDLDEETFDHVMKSSTNIYIETITYPEGNIFE